MLGYRVWFQPMATSDGGYAWANVAIAAEGADGGLEVIGWVRVNDACGVEPGERTCAECRVDVNMLVQPLPAP